ncbi:YdcH family protein [Celeribacter indicus]|uniref:DUF465 domain-containing protein n=1 Tax=Celeribacter indicus TaxID=1208324 RepID=A0A0B5E1B6_9RHOB|nr:YdcH family protein [Celeribacter indicus]AJE46252.1 hypothetical protein P73_1537 [Celeribacter indicus]SDW51181.1 hypothetical protein SAMN05443573_10485 [Celeribacter indicus]
MSNTPHQLAADFPDHIGRISALLATEPHFARLVKQYNAVNEEVHLAETDLRPMEDLALVELRKKRAMLKDELYRMLTMTA